MIVTVFFVSTYFTSGLAILRFTCNNGSAILESQFCDERQVCKEESDKILSSTNCIECVTENQIGCPNERMTENVITITSTCLIDRGYFCNGTVACLALDPCDVGCPEYYRCNDNTCVRRSTVCDGDPLNGCNEDDGWKSGIGFQCVRNGDYCRIPQQLLWDEVQDCDQEEDLCYNIKNTNEGRNGNVLSHSSFNQSRCFKCLEHSMIIPRHKVCDGVIDCSDLSDECLCDEEVPDICRNVIHLESAINNLSRSPPTCKVGQVSCGDGTCIERSSVCDSVADCHDNRDERFSYCRGTLQCKYGQLKDEGTECRCDATHINVVGVLCNGNDECPGSGLGGKWVEPPELPADECQAKCSYQSEFNCTINFLGGNISKVHTSQCLAWQEGTGERNSSAPPMQISYSTLDECDGFLKCTASGDDEADCPHRFSCPAGRLISIPRSQVCDGIEDCDDKTDEKNVTCPHRFFCRLRSNPNKVSIAPQLVCDFNINCDDKSDEKNCSISERFYCENGRPLFVERRKVFDGRGDCSDMSDECPLIRRIRSEDGFSSIYQLIDNPVLRVVIWIMAVLALVGNGVVIVAEGRKLTEVLKKKNNVPLRTNLLLISNLAIADFLMGVYLLILGIVGIFFDGVFCLHEMKWRASATCTILGVLVVLSSEASVMTMILLTSFRLYCVTMPFKARNKPKLSFLLFLLGIVWLIALLLALLPLSSYLDYIFTEFAVLRESPFFRHAIVSLGKAKLWASKLLTFDQDLSLYANETLANIYGAKNWKQLQEALENSSSSEYLKVSSYLGYYSANCVCIPRIFVRREDKSWKFSLPTTIFNFLAFCYVAIIYLYILFHQRNNSLKTTFRTRRERREKKDMRLRALQGKIARLVLTDFCCWVPISIMEFIHFSEGNIPRIAYVISAIVLLPINSALNPLLYSDFIDELFARAKKSIKSSKIKRTLDGHAGTMRTKRVILTKK